MDEVVLSIICLAYNHERFVSDAIEGFINQKTNYPFEVLINDDASTDGTAKIIREYEKKYPNIIKATYQTENQYKKRSLILDMLGQAKGKYFAFCEGDDCWTDCTKVQVQLDYLEQHPDCSLCVHNSTRVTADGKPLSDIIVTERDRVITTEECIRGRGDFCATNSIVGKTSLAQNVPSFLRNCGLDYTWQIFLSASGSAYCFSKKMSLYRVGVSGSWSERMERNPEEYAKVFFRINNMLTESNDWSNQKYNATISDCILGNNYTIAVKTNNTSMIKSPEMKRWIKNQGVSFRLKHIMWSMFPRLYHKIRTIRLKRKYGFTISK